MRSLFRLILCILWLFIPFLHIQANKLTEKNDGVKKRSFERMQFSGCMDIAKKDTIQTQSELELIEKAKELHFSIITVDTHCDVPMKMSWYDVGERHDFGYFDLPRMKDGGLAVIFFAVYEPQGPLTREGRENAFKSANKTLGLIANAFEKHNDQCELGIQMADVERIFKIGMRCIFIGMENGYPLGLDVSNVDYFYRRGVRYITLAHKDDNDICDSSTDNKNPEDKGLSEFGVKVVKRMNELGMMVDVSHISEKSFFDVLSVTLAPVIASHSCIRALKEHPQNLTDEQLNALKKNGGVVQINFVSDHLKYKKHIPALENEMNKIIEWLESKGGYQKLTKEEKDRFTKETRQVKFKYPEGFGMVKDVVDHIDYVAEKIGIDHVGIGSDFEGGGWLSDCYTVASLPNITVELLRRDYSHEEIEKIWGGNLLRVFREVEMKAARLSKSPRS